MKRSLFQLNAGTGMALGAIAAAIVALIVQIATHDAAIWTWAIPVGIAVGLAIGAGARRQSSKGPGRSDSKGA